MKKFRIFLLVMTGAAVLMLGGCKEKAKYDESAFQDDLEPLTDDELEDMDENSDDEMIVEDDAELEQSQQQEDSTEKADAESTDSNEETQSKLDEKGTYTDKDEVAQYYDNADKMLPVEDGITYQQCSLDSEEKQKIIFTQDGKRVYYTEDDGKSFEEIY